MEGLPPRERTAVVVCLVVGAFFTSFAWGRGQGIETLVTCVVILVVALVISRFGSRPPTRLEDD